MLLEISELFDVELIELIDGERKNNIDIKESSIKLADYSEESKRKLMRNMNYLFIGGTIAGIIYMVLLFNDLDNNFFGGLCVGIMFGMMIVGVIITSRYGFVMREKSFLYLKSLELNNKHNITDKAAPENLAIRSALIISGSQPAAKPI